MRRIALFIIAAGLLAACSKHSPDKAPAGPKGAEALPPPAYEAALPEELRARINQPFKGDLPQMLARRVIRIAAPFNRSFYYLDAGQPRGLSYEYSKLYEESLNGKLGKQSQVYVILLPVPRDQLLAALTAGKVDMAVAQLTITPERLRLVDFTVPTRTGVDEILVGGPGSPPISSLDQMAGRTVFVRRSSSYYQSVEQLNARLKAAGRAPVRIEAAPENLEDDDLLEMVNAGLIDATVVDNYLAQFWKKIFPGLVLSERAPLRSGGQLAVAIRKGSPKLAASLNEFISAHSLNSAIGATINNKYLRNTQYVKNADAETERKKFLDTVELFRKYGTQYDFDYLLMAAQGYQESRLDQNARSRVGAIGVMQLMPATGAEQKVGDVHQLDPNIHGGVKYMRFMMDRYYSKEPMDRLNKELFTFASYNAGPGAISRMRREAAGRGLNPNLWFGNVEQVTAERIGSEPVNYVGNIFKYYIAYKLITEERANRKASREALARAPQGR